MCNHVPRVWRARAPVKRRLLSLPKLFRLYPPVLFSCSFQTQALKSVPGLCILSCFWIQKGGGNARPPAHPPTHPPTHQANPPARQGSNQRQPPIQAILPTGAPGSGLSVWSPQLHCDVLQEVAFVRLESHDLWGLQRSLATIFFVPGKVSTLGCFLLPCTFSGLIRKKPIGWEKDKVLASKQNATKNRHPPIHANKETSWEDNPPDTPAEALPLETSLQWP